MAAQSVFLTTNTRHYQASSSASCALQTKHSIKHHNLAPPRQCSLLWILFDVRALPKSIVPSFKSILKGISAAVSGMSER